MTRLPPFHGGESLRRPRLAVRASRTVGGHAGTAAAEVLRRIAFRAGTYAPGIHDAIFAELPTPGCGDSIDDVEGWFEERRPALARLGYRLGCRRIDVPTEQLLPWLEAGEGHRGLVLPVTCAALHPARPPCPDVDDVVGHAVGLVAEGWKTGGLGRLVTIDPSAPGETIHEVPHDRAAAYLDGEHAALALYWASWP